MTPLPASHEIAARIFGGRLTISRDQAAKALGIGRDYLTALIEEGLITCIWCGNRARFRIEDLTGFLAAPKVPKAYQQPPLPQGRPSCPSTGRAAARPMSTTSAAVVTDIRAIRAQRAAAKPKRSRAKKSPE